MGIITIKIVSEYNFRSVFKRPKQLENLFPADGSFSLYVTAKPGKSNNNVCASAQTVEIRHIVLRLTTFSLKNINDKDYYDEHGTIRRFIGFLSLSSD